MFVGNDGRRWVTPGTSVRHASRSVASGCTFVRSGDKEGRIGDFLFFKQAARRNVRQAVLFPANPANDWVQAVRHRDRDGATDGVSRDKED